ncbi:hypothetical protein CJI97_003272 [Candidozyma auris]|nr:hypothetical protein CJI97_003272 [[Candida] auris]
MAHSNANIHLTEDVIADFAGTGSQRLIEKLHVKDVPKDTMSEIFIEILICLEDGSLTSNAIADFLQQAINDEEKAIIFCQALDVVPLTESMEALMGELNERQAVIKPKTIAENVDLALLTSSNLAPVQSLNRQLNMKKRDIFYTQKNFNLFHEEFEGYSKLVQEMFNILKTSNNVGLVDFAIRSTESLIGHYQLDPNRVLDILLDVFTHLIVGNHVFMIKFLKSSRWWPAEPATSDAGFEELRHGGSETAAKSLGLKFLKASKDEALTDTFKVMVAILVKEGFVSFGSIYKYVRPDDTEMQDLEALYKKELDEKVFKSGASALALAAPLTSEDDISDKGANGSNKDEEQQSINETLQSRLETNITFQVLKAFLEVGLYWPSLYIITEFPFLVHVDALVPEYILRMVDVIISPLYENALKVPESLIKALNKDRLSPQAHNMGSIKYKEVKPTRMFCLKPTSVLQSDKDLIYFYQEWSRNLPRVDKIDAFFKLGQEIFKYLGTKLSADVAVFSKLCDVLTSQCVIHGNTEYKERCFNFFRNYILPAIGAIEENPVPVSKAFKFLQQFSVDDRFNLYGELHQVLAKNNLHVKINYNKAEKATKDSLKRLSKENVAPMMKRLAKISYSNPLPCFLTILQQIESYDNLNSLVVDTAQYFSKYGWDNLTLAILMRLTSLGRSNIQQDGLHERQWIQSLASFIGQLCHKYPDSIDLRTIVSYLVKSFHLQESSGLLVFKEILALTGGLKPISNLTPHQIEMINSGESLEKLVYKTIDDTRFSSQLPGTKLANVFLELDVVNEILVLLSNLNKAIIAGEELTHLKVLANRADDIDTVLHFFCTLVGFFGDDEIPNNLQAITTLVDKYGVPIPWAFEIWRPYFTDTEVQGDIGEKFTCGVEPSLFTTFWSLKLFDINFDRELYDSELSKLESTASSLRETLLVARKDRSSTSAFLQKLKADIVRTEDFHAKIPAERDFHETHNKEVKELLKQRCRSWFLPNTDEELATAINTFLQECVFPRCVHSSFDAIFSARFLFLVHELNPNNYSIIEALNQIFQSDIVFGALFTCTPSEAECLGIFYAEILKRLSVWYNEEVFAGLAQATPLKKNISSSNLSLGDFKKILFEFHSSLLSDISRSLIANEYMCRRNAITLMKNLFGVYPNVEDHCETIVDLIEKISTTEERDDLKLSSSAFIGHVKSRSKSWVHMWDFYDMSEDEKAKQIDKRKAIEENRERRKEALRRQKEEEERRMREEEERRRQEARLAEEEERKRKMEEERIEQQKQATAKALSYDNEGKAPIRQARNEEVERGRYDQYSRTTPRPETPKGPSAQSRSADSMQNKASKVLEQKDLKVKKLASEETKPQQATPGHAKEPDVEKARDEAKPMEDAKTQSNIKRDSPAAEAPTQIRASTPSHRRPLPPQQPPRQPRFGSSGRHEDRGSRHDDRGSRHDDRGSRHDDRDNRKDSGNNKVYQRGPIRSQSTTPLPPPSTPPPPPPTAPLRKGSDRDRGDRKRGWGGFRDRGQKRARY